MLTNRSSMGETKHVWKLSNAAVIFSQDCTSNFLNLLQKNCSTIKIENTLTRCTMESFLSQALDLVPVSGVCAQALWQVLSGNVWVLLICSGMLRIFSFKSWWSPEEEMFQHTKEIKKSNTNTWWKTVPKHIGNWGDPLGQPFKLKWLYYNSNEGENYLNRILVCMLWKDPWVWTEKKNNDKLHRYLAFHYSTFMKCQISYIWAITGWPGGNSADNSLKSWTLWVVNCFTTKPE